MREQGADAVSGITLIAIVVVALALSAVGLAQIVRWAFG